eukprot:TRINITY_DN1240_c0_g1_i1.p1 TRINITY_DN1240_c0_g1~~TRINITY_DN1240_c0_g1_i1.p1  ORF type:complete len:262 (+),score=59.45 TRINITY_DN1240_c0_g1_i1:239-1024(+)
MLAVFEKAIAHAPAGLDARVHLQGTASAKNQELTGMSGLEILNAFKERQVAVHFGQGSGLAYSLEHQRELLRPRAFVSQESVFLLFKGHLSNMNKLRQMYGITKAVTEELLIIEVYKALRDRAPYPADVAVKHLEGNFGFVLFDQSNSTIFAATDAQNGVGMYWGTATDGSLVFADSKELIKGCGTSAAPFPSGFYFSNFERGLVNYQKPNHSVKAVPHVNSSGQLCGAFFKVDSQAQLNNAVKSGMHQVGSEMEINPWQY